MLHPEALVGSTHTAGIGLRILRCRQGLSDKPARHESKGGIGEALG